MRYDLVIAGCGTAGATAALVAAKAGLKVCVIERKVRADIGRKVCGDAIHVDHLEFARNLGIEFGEKELLNKIAGMYLIAPNRKDKIYVEDEGWCINRRLFGQKLVQEVDKSCMMLNSAALSPIVEGDKVIGVKTDRGDVLGTVTMDATGMGGTLRRQIPFETDFPKELGPMDLAKAYRGIVETEESFDTPNAIKIEFNNEIAPAGYIWYFPKASNVLNIGLGLKGSASPMDNYQRFVASQFRIRKALDEGAWVLPIRRPFDGFVADGFMIAGDAAVQVNPLDGAGIGYSMRGGAMAAEAAIAAGAEPTRERLWQYNVRFQTEIGAKHAQSAIFTSALASLSNDDLNFVFGNKLITTEDIRRSYTGKMGLGPMEMLKKLAIGMGNRAVLSKLYKTVKLAKMAKRHYAGYPSMPEHLSKWSEDTAAIFAMSDRAFPIWNAK